MHSALKAGTPYHLEPLADEASAKVEKDVDDEGDESEAKPKKRGRRAKEMPTSDDTSRNFDEKSIEKMLSFSEKPENEETEEEISFP